MTTLREAAQQALEALELGYDSAKSEADQYHAAMAGFRPERHAQMDADVQQIAAAITALRAALAQEQANPPGCDHCNHPLYAATRCRVCGRVTERAKPTRSQQMADAGFTRRPSLWSLQARKALELIAAPQRPDGTWNRDREACRQLAAEALGRYDDD